MLWLAAAAALVVATSPADAAAVPPALTFLDLEGRPVPLAGVMAGKPTLLVFLRHFG